MGRNHLIRLRRGTAADWSAVNPVLASGEPGVETDTGQEKIGNGVDAWDDLDYVGSSYALTDGDKGDIVVSGGGTVWNIDALAVTDTEINDVAWSKVTGEPTTLAGYGISDTKANFNTACSDGDFLFVGDIVGVTDGDKGDITVSASGATWTIDSGLDAAKLADGSVSNTEFQYLNGVSSNIQTQLDGKVTSGGALGTPSSGTLTNCSGLPLSGVVDSTSEALGVGSLELGHATDTTIARNRAGQISIEGKIVPQTITKSADQSITSDDVLNDDSELVFTVPNGTAAKFHYDVLWETNSVPDFQFRINCSAAPTKIAYRRIHTPPGGTALTTAMSEALETVAATGANSGVGHLLVWGTIVNSTGSDFTVAFQWAQNTSNAATTSVLKGSQVTFVIQ